jgi:hypothetical protein
MSFKIPDFYVVWIMVHIWKRTLCCKFDLYLKVYIPSAAFDVRFLVCFVCFLEEKIGLWYYQTEPVDPFSQNVVSTIRRLMPLFISPLWSSGQSSWLQIQRSWVRVPSLPDFQRSSGPGTGSTQPREDNWGATWKEIIDSGLENRN